MSLSPGSVADTYVSHVHGGGGGSYIWLESLANILALPAIFKIYNHC